MTRKKVKLAYITNDSARKATFKKRKKGLMKKVSELSTLCGIEACAIICSPYDAQPEVWPSPLGVQRVLSQFQKLPEMEQSKKMMNQESFLRQRITKASDNLKKQRKDNREKEVTQAMFQCLTGKSLQNLNLMDLNDLGWMIDQNLKEINKRFGTFQTATTSQMAGPSGENASQRAEMQNFEVKNDNLQRQQWIVDFLTPQEPSGFGGPDEMLLPFVDNNQNPLWSNNFFP